jgi:hypothetical protein
VGVSKEVAEKASETLGKEEGVAAALAIPRRPAFPECFAAKMFFVLTCRREK